MRNGRSGFITALLATTAPAGLLVVGPALAQKSPGEVPPVPVHQSVDANGVDVVLGTYNYTQPSVSIGPSYPDGLSFTNTQRGQGWVANVRATVFQSGSTYIVTIDGVSDSFNKLGTAFTSNEGNGATLVDNGGDTLTYGSRIGVSAILTVNDAGTYLQGYARATSITYPSGLRVDFTYKEANFCRGGYEGGTCPGGIFTARRLQSATNTNGYQLKFTYAINTLDPDNPDPVAWQQITRVTAINNGVEYCDPNADSCTLTSSWPSLAITNSSTATAVTDAMSRTTNYTTAYDSTSSLSSFTVKWPGSTSDNITVAYDAGRHVSSVRNDGILYTYVYSDTVVSGDTIRTTTVTDPTGGKKVYIGNLTKLLLSSFKDELNRTTGYTYDSMGRVTDIVYPEGNKVHYDYDARGNVMTTTRISKTPGTPNNIITSASFDAMCLASKTKTCNSPNTTTDPLGNVTNYTYNTTHGGVLTVTAPPPATGAVRPQTRYGYMAVQGYYKNGAGSIVASGQSTYRLTSASACATQTTCTGGSADETIATIDYGPQTAGTANNLLPIAQTIAEGDGSPSATTGFTYDSIGNRIYVDGPLSGVSDRTRLFINDDREVVGVIGPDPDATGALKNRATRLTRNDLGQVTLAEQGTTDGQSGPDWAAFVPLQKVATTYDIYARKTKDVTTAGSTTYSVTQYSYGTLNRPNCTAQRMTPATWNSQPDACMQATPAGSFGQDRISQQQWDAASQLTAVKSGLGTPTSRTDQTFDYNDNGTTNWVEDARGNRTTYIYDGYDRLSETRYPSPTTAHVSSTTNTEQIGYDKASNVLQRQLRDMSNINYLYDDLNRVMSKNPPGSDPPVTYTYDNFNRVKSASSTASSLSFTYDGLGRQLTATQPYGTVSSAYDVAGRRIKLTWDDGTPAFFVNYDYLVTGEMSAVREKNATTGSGVLAMYDYDDLGQRKTATLGNGVINTYTFDPGSRLTSVLYNSSAGGQDLRLTMAYNRAGQIVSRTSDKDQYAWNDAVNGTTNYQRNGLNQYSTVAGTTQSYDLRGNLLTGAGVTYAYTAENLLKSASGGVTATLAYDPAGRLTQYIVPSGTTRFLYDGGVPIAEKTTAGAVARRYVFGAGADEVLLWYEGSGTTDRRWLRADERGSVIGVMDATGVVTDKNAYDEYGIPETTNVGRFGYTGQMWLAEIGLYNYKARMLSPRLGRFLQTDPIGYDEGMNWYNYVGSDPINFTDPLGLSRKSTQPPLRPVNGNEGGPGDVGGYTGPEVVVVGCGGTCQANLQELQNNLLFQNLIRSFLHFANDPVAGGGTSPPPPRPDLICRFANSIFDGGKGTVQLGLSGTGELGPGAATGGFGVALDRYGDVGLYSFFGGGAGAGAYVGAGGTGQISNAEGINNLSGGFVTASGSGGLGPSASADVFTGPSAGGLVSGGGITYGGGAGIGAFSGATFTTVAPMFNAKNALGC